MWHIIVCSAQRPRNNMYLRVVLLAAGLVAVCAHAPAAKYPKCDPNMIENIKAYWEGAGTPEKVMSSEGVFKTYKSSALDLNKDVKCRTYDFIPEGKIKFNIDGTEATVDAVEKDGVLTLPDKKSYIIMNDDDVMATYNCSEDNDTPDDDPTTKEDCTILVGKNAEPNSLSHAEGILRLLDCHLAKEYNCK